MCSVSCHQKPGMKEKTPVTTECITSLIEKFCNQTKLKQEQIVSMTILAIEQCSALEKEQEMASMFESNCVIENR